MSSAIVTQGPLAEINALQAQYQRGLLSEAEYRRLFYEVDARTGRPCADCARKPAVMKSEGRSLCSACSLIVIKTTRRLVRIPA